MTAAGTANLESGMHILQTIVAVSNSFSYLDTIFLLDRHYYLDVISFGTLNKYRSYCAASNYQYWSSAHSWYNTVGWYIVLIVARVNCEVWSLLDALPYCN